MTFNSTTWRILYGILVAIFICFVGWFSLRDTATQLHNRINGATLTYNVGQQVIFHQWQCIPVSWDVEGIENIFFDDRPAIGQQETTYCPTTANLAQPMLYIDFQGNFIQEFPVPLTIVTEQAWFWVGSGILTLLGLLTLPILPTGQIIPAQVDTGRRRLLVGVGATALLALAGMVGVGATNRTPQIVITDGWVLRENEVNRS